MIVAVTVGVALRRPPHLDELRRVLVEADTEVEAELIAVQIYVHGRDGRLLRGDRILEI